MTIEQLKVNNLLLFECVAGSKAYGLSTSSSDTDIRGVFVLPEQEFFGLHYTEQLSFDNNNIVYYELKRFVELLARNNPNVLELLGIKREFIRIEHPLFRLLTPSMFLSKRCKDTFARYAFSQIKKAYGLNKKILNPIAPERKTILDFCHILRGYGSLPLSEWIIQTGYRQEQCGLVHIPHFRDTYAVFYDTTATFSFRGIMLKYTSDDVATSSVPKGMEPVGILSFNREGYSRYCRDYNAYRKWEQERNEARYRNTLEHGKNYDTKNMMHVFRLLSMAEEIATEVEIHTYRTDREMLFDIRNGKFVYEELVALAEEKLARIEELFAVSSLPEEPDEEMIVRTLVFIRKAWYDQSKRNL
jgi:hypothetical protein